MRPTKGRIGVRHGFTLAEIMVVTILVALAAVLALPQLGDDTRIRLVAAAAVLASDIEAAQMMTIASPDSPVVVRFDESGRKYWLAYAATPTTPLIRSDNGAKYAVSLGAGRAAGADGVTIAVADMPGNTLEFDAQGALTDFTVAPSIRLSLQNRWYQLDVSASTGTVTESEGHE